MSSPKNILEEETTFSDAHSESDQEEDMGPNSTKFTSSEDDPTVIVERPSSMRAFFLAASATADVEDMSQVEEWLIKPKHPPSAKFAQGWLDRFLKSSGLSSDTLFMIAKAIMESTQVPRATRLSATWGQLRDSVRLFLATALIFLRQAVEKSSQLHWELLSRIMLQQNLTIDPNQPVDRSHPLYEKLFLVRPSGKIVPKPKARAGRGPQLPKN